MRDDVVQRRRAVVARLVRLRDEGGLDTAAVTVAAVSLGVHIRTVWRWIETGGYEPRPRERWHLTATAREAYYETKGNAAAAWSRLRDAGVDVPSRPVFCRAVLADLSPAERAYVRHGEDGRRRYELYLRHEPKARNDVWEMDHAQLDIEVLPLRGTRLVKPWLTVVIDGYSRLVMGWALSIRPTTAEVLAALREAIVVDEQRSPWGGIPQLVRFDGGKEFLAKAITRAAGEVGFAATPTAPYSPHQKGKVERLHQTIGKGLIATLPHYTGGPRRRDGKLYSQPDPLSIEQLQAALLEFIDAYNRTHEHASLGMTPAEKWATSSAPLELAEAERLGWMLMADQTRKVLKDGIHFGGQIFIGPKLARHVGRTVEVRYMPHDLRSIEIFIEPDGWLCTAYPQDQLSREDAEAVIAARQQAAREMGRRKANASRKARARTAPLTGSTVVTDITVVTRRDKNRVRRGLTDAASNQLLEMLGLADQLNKPAPPQAPSPQETER
jgi:putative transposase